MQGRALEVGPAAVWVPGGPAGGPDPLTEVALAALDDPVALVDGRPVEVTALLRTVLAGALAQRHGPVTVVHPCAWPPNRVRRVLAAVAAVAGPAVALSRAEVLRRDEPQPAAVVEFAAETVAVSTPGGEVRVFGRGDLPAIAGAAGRECAVLLDAPEGVPGARAAAAELRKLLAPNATRIVDLRAVLAPATPAATPRRRPRASVPAVAATLAVLAVLAVLAGAIGTWPQSGTSRPSVTLVEGRIAVEVPADWPVRRVTGGPGSRRVEVVSPSDGAEIVHITGSYAPETSLEQTARVLERAVAAASPGVFADFRADARVAGRPAVTYRERRPGREVLWTVVLDGAMRISIGCQSPPPGAAIRPVCDAVIGSARDAGAF